MSFTPVITWINTYLQRNRKHMMFWTRNWNHRIFDNFLNFIFIFFQTFKYVRMPSNFYLQRNYETKRYFKYMGVNIFRLLLINSFFRHLNNRVYLKGRAKDYLLTFIEETKQSETSHIISGIFPLSVQLLYLKYGLIEHFIWLSIFNLILNLYPFLLQRMNRFNMLLKYPNLTKEN